MREGLFQLLFYTQIGIGIAALSSTGSVSAVAGVISFVALGLGLYLDAHQHILLPVRYAKFVFFPLILFLLYSVFFAHNGWFYAILDTLLLVAAVKLVSPKANRDYLQIIAIGFLLILATSLLTTDALFSFYFVAYIFFLCWTLMVFTVKAVLEGDENPLRSEVAVQQAHLPSDLASDLLDRGLFLRSAVVILFVMIFTVLFFMFFPRFGAGLIGGTLGIRNKVSGMSNSIRFDNFSQLKPDSTIVVRIMETKGHFPLPAYLRGKVLDTYVDNQWQATRRRRRLPFASGTARLTRTNLPAPLHYRILASDLGVQAIPVLAGTSQLRFGGRPLWGYGDETAERPSLFRGAFAMDAQAHPNGYILGDSITDITSIGNNLIDDIPVAADAVTHDAGQQAVNKLLTLASLAPAPATDSASQLTWLQRLARYLRRNFRYTLTPPASHTDPLLAFVERKAGHCEYFASMLVLAARRAGMPARIVTGFAGGERSTLGDYIFFRNSDAHSWVEVYFGHSGWLGFDPTPPYHPSPPGFFASLWRNVGNVTDLYQLWWINRVVNYDINDQQEILQQVRKSLKGFNEGQRRRWFQQLPDWVKAAAASLIVLAVFLVAWLTLRPENRLKRLQLRYTRPSRRDRRMLRKLERLAGSRRNANETWPAFVQRTAVQDQLPKELEQSLLRYLQRRYQD